MSRILLIAILLLPTSSSLANPYCISGANWAANGVMNRLNMPSESLGYIWDNLQVTNRVQMVRPCKYWLSTNRSHLPHGYHEEDDTIHDPAVFADWIVANPGKIWLIGNEPDLPSQDGLTTAQYAAMYRTYHTFIRQHDPTAVFAVAAKAGDAHPGNVQHAINWWTDVLNIYKSNNGTTMPVDIWNFHCYAPPYLRDVEDYMSLFVTPFTQWVRTVEDGAYADVEIWNTEFGIGFWMGQLNARWVEPWMQRVCLRLEESEVDRWFWFYGPWDNWSVGGEWQQTSLIGPDGQPTLLGQRYSDMARGWPHAQATPMPDPEVLPAPDEFYTNFEDDDVSLWIDKAGPWRADNGMYHCDLQFPMAFSGLSTLPPYRYDDVSIEVRLRINNPFNNTQHWAGVELGRGNMFGRLNESGWLAYLRYSGAVGLHSQATGTVTSVANAVPAATEWNTIRVDAGGIPMQYDVYVNNERKLRWFDMDSRFPEGFVTLVSGQTNCSFDEVRITKGSLMTPQAVNGDFEAADLKPWLRWDGVGSADAVVQPQADVGRGNSRGLRVGASVGGPLDVGVRRATAGAQPGERYLLEGWVRAVQTNDPTMRVRIGLDPTGQIDDPQADTIVWAEPQTNSTDWQRLRTPLVTATAGRLGMFLRVSNTTAGNVTAFFDDIALLDEQGSLDGNALLMVE